MSEFEGHLASEELRSGPRLRSTTGADPSRFVDVVDLHNDGSACPLCFCCPIAVVDVGIVRERVVGMECRD